MANIRTFFANAYEVTLAAQMGPTALSFEVTTAAGAPSLPAYMKLTDPNDVNQREYVLVSSVDGTTFTIASINDRYLSGSSAGSGITHEIGETVKCSPVAQMFDDLHDRVESRLSSSAHTKSLHDGLSLDHALLSNLGVGDPHGQYLDVARHDTPSRHGSNAVDHGSIGGLGDDDHPQYLLKTGGTMTGGLTVPGVQLGVTTLGTTGTLTLSMNGADFVTTGTLTGNVTFASSNRAAGRSVTARVVNGGTTRTLSFPAGWRFVGSKPEEIEANKTGVLALTAFGTDDASVVAAWAVEE